jgi:hypothetical protein
VNKTVLEDHVESTLKSIYLAFPDLTKICKIVDFPRLQPVWLSLGANVVEYCKAVARYTGRHRITRLLYAATHPPGRGLDDLRGAIEKDAVAIRDCTHAYTVKKLEYLAQVAEGMFATSLIMIPVANTRKSLKSLKRSSFSNLQRCLTLR